MPKEVTNGEAWRRTFIGSVTSAVAVLGGIFGYFQFNPPRPDPYTGQQAREMRAELRREVEMLENHHDQLESQLDAIKDDIIGIWQFQADLPPDRWRRRIEALEIEAIKKNPDYDVPQ